MTAGRPVRLALVTTGGSIARAELSKTGGSVTMLGEKTSLAGKVMKGVFAGMGGWFAATEIVHGIKDIVSETSQFQSSMTLLQTAGGELSKNMGTVSDGILKMTGQVGTSIGDLSEGMYTVEKAGYRGAKGLDVLKASAEGARAENVDMATMTTAVTSVMTSYHKSAGQAVSVVNQMVAASGEAKTTMQQFAGSLSTVLPVASANKISFAQVGGALAMLTQHGTSANEATVELANTIRNLAAPNQVAQKEMQQLGINVTNLETHLGDMQKGGRGLVGTLDLLVNTIGHKMGPAGTVLLDAFKKSQSATGDLRVELDAMPKSLRAISTQFESGKLSYKEYYGDVKALGGQQYALGKGFISTFNAAKGFNNILTSGQPAAQTMTAALKAMLGGATGLNTALQLTGENSDLLKAKVKGVADAGKHAGKDISTWPQTLHTFSVQISNFENGLQAIGVRIGLKLLPNLTDGIGSLNNGLTHIEPSLQAFGHDLGDVAKVVGDIPKPIRSMGIEALLLVPVLKMVSTGFNGMLRQVGGSTSGLKAWTVAAIDSETRTTALGLAGLKLKESMGTLAGIGGILALSASASQSNHALSALKQTAGDAAIGFSVAGPWGAAIGGGIGLLHSLVGGFHDTTSAAQVNAGTLNRLKYSVAASQMDNLRQTLNATTGAYTKNTKAAIDNWLRTDSTGKTAFASLQTTGASERTIMQAILGSPAANRSLTTSVQSDMSKLNSQIRDINTQIQQNTHSTSLSGAQISDYNNQLKQQLQPLIAQKNKLKDAIAAMQGEGVALKDAAAAQRQYNAASGSAARQLGITKKAFDALPKNVRTTLTLAGATKSLSDLAAAAHTVKMTRPEAIATLKVEGLPQSKANIAALVNAMRNGGNQAGGLGESVGVHYGDGIVAGLRARLGSVEAASAELVNRALKSSNRAAQIQSPSKKTKQIGKYYAQGLALGIRQNAKTAEHDAEQMVIKALAATKVRTVSGVHDIISKATTAANKDLEKEISKANKLYSNVRSIYLSAHDTITSSADITQMGANPVGVVSYSAMLAGLKKQTASEVAWARAVKKLNGEGLNKTTLRQLLNAGPSSMSTVQALLTGGSKGIKQVNSLEGQLNAAGSSLGNRLAKSWYGAGEQAAKGLVKELNRDKRQFDKWSGNVTHNIHIDVKASPTADKVAIGKEIQKALDAYYAAGGRGSAKGKKGSGKAA